METTMYALLATAKANNASDLHITVGVGENAVSSGTLYEMQGFDVLTPGEDKRTGRIHVQCKTKRNHGNPR